MNTDIQAGTGRLDRPLTRADVELLRSKVDSSTQLDLSYQNLQKINLSYFDLQGTNLHGANLQEANLRGSNLGGADLRGADLSHADLDGADLSHAKPGESESNRVKLHNARLSYTRLRGLDLHGFDLTGIDLQNADLSGTDLCDARLHGADLRGADLSNARLHGPELLGARLYNEKLFGGTARKTDRDSTKLERFVQGGSKPVLESSSTRKRERPIMIDLRSDTVTLPSPAMREAMYRAELGDDVYGEDPTVNRLQELAAERMGKEAALFVPSGTMGNTAAVLAHTGRGEAFIVGDQSHIYQHELGGASTIGGSPRHVVATDADGMLDLHQIRVGISDGSDEHTAVTALLCIENTHNRCGGTVLSVAQVEQLSELAHAHGVTVHMDGARIFNAAIALGVPVSTLARTVDSVMFCLSKGLSAPVGSMVVGSRDFISRAHRMRKLLGGGMRQAGVIAAAGIVALEQMVNRMAEDHEYCKQLAYGLAEYPQIDVEVERVVTNMLVFSLRNAQQEALTEEETMQFLEKAREHGVLMGHIGEGKIRAVTHYGLDGDDITAALTGIRRALIEMKR